MTMCDNWMECGIHLQSIQLGRKPTEAEIAAEVKAMRRRDREERQAAKQRQSAEGADLHGSERMDRLEERMKSTEARHDERMKKMEAMLTDLHAMVVASSSVVPVAPKQKGKKQSAGRVQHARGRRKGRQDVTMGDNDEVQATEVGSPLQQALPAATETEEAPDASTETESTPEEAGADPTEEVEGAMADKEAPDAAIETEEPATKDVETDEGADPDVPMEEAALTAGDPEGSAGSDASAEDKVPPDTTDEVEVAQTMAQLVTDKSASHQQVDGRPICTKITTSLKFICVPPCFTDVQMCMVFHKNAYHFAVTRNV